MAEFSNKAAFCITHRINGFGSLSEKCPERASYQSPGLAAKSAANPGLCDAAALRLSPRCMGGHLAKKVQM